MKQRSQNNLVKDQIEKFILTDFKIYYKATLIKNV